MRSDTIIFVKKLYIPCAPIDSLQEVSIFFIILKPVNKVLFIKFLLSNGKKRRLVIRQLIAVFPQFLLLNNVNPINIDTNIIDQVRILRIILNCIFEFIIGIKNQKLAAPQRIEKGNNPSSGINVFVVFSEKLLVFQFEGDRNILYIKRRL